MTMTRTKLGLLLLLPLSTLGIVEVASRISSPAAEHCAPSLVEVPLTSPPAPVAPPAVPVAAPRG
jgi:hypothetical protein